ncbi:MAG: hypothetical protein IPP85_11185 [Propionivibrio sp.]|nr:hypothetical protein [Propionivibrio sp.]
MRMQVQYNMTNQFLMASLVFLRKAEELELALKTSSDQTVLCRMEVEHKGLITSLLMQCVSAAETAIFMVITNGPGHHLGTNGIDQDARSFLIKFEKELERLSVLEKYQAVLKLLRKPEFDTGQNPHQAMQLVVAIRNELVHFKPVGVYPFQEDSEKMLKRLRSLKLKHSPFPGSKSIYFPNACLSSALGHWALTTTVQYMDCFYELIGSGNPLQGYRDWITEFC